MTEEIKPEKKKRGNPNMTKGNTMGAQHWKPGQSGNPAGRVKNPEIQLLRDAFEKAKGLKGDQSFLENVCVRAYEDTPLAIALLRKLLPDMTKAEIEEAKSITIVITNYKDAGKDKDE